VKKILKNHKLIENSLTATPAHILSINNLILVINLGK